MKKLLLLLAFTPCIFAMEHKFKPAGKSLPSLNALYENINNKEVIDLIDSDSDDQEPLNNTYDISIGNLHDINLNKIRGFESKQDYTYSNQINGGEIESDPYLNCIDLDSESDKEQNYSNISNDNDIDIDSEKEQNYPNIFSDNGIGNDIEIEIEFEDESNSEVLSTKPDIMDLDQANIARNLETSQIEDQEKASKINPKLNPEINLGLNPELNPKSSPKSGFAIDWQKPEEINQIINPNLQVQQNFNNCNFINFNADEAVQILADMEIDPIAQILVNMSRQNRRSNNSVPNNSASNNFGTNNFESDNFVTNNFVANKQETNNSINKHKIMFKCCFSGCPHKYFSKKALESHYELMHDAKVLSCTADDCAYCTINKSNFTRHMKTHANTDSKEIRPYHCNYPGCNYAAVQKTTLVDHINRHKGVKPYHCDICDIRFAARSSLRQHVNTKKHSEKRAELLAKK